MNAPAAEVVGLLTVRGETVAVAESLTGGLVAAEITSVPGASKVFRGSITAYATELKHTLAGVPEELLRDRGPVDAEVAGALAAGARDRCQADWGLATTGVAGPEPQDGKPVGLVYVAVAGPGDPVVRELHVSGNRTAVRTESVTAVLSLFAEELRGLRECGDQRTG